MEATSESGLHQRSFIGGVERYEEYERRISGGFPDFSRTDWREFLQ
jgi:hypothetical protein